MYETNWKMVMQCNSATLLRTLIDYGSRVNSIKILILIVNIWKLLQILFSLRWDAAVCYWNFSNPKLISCNFPNWNTRNKHLLTFWSANIAENSSKQTLWELTPSLCEYKTQTHTHGYVKRHMCLQIRILHCIHKGWIARG